MRLINVHTLKVEEHYLHWDGTAYKPSYAILSHTWLEGEVVFGDLDPDKFFLPAARTKKGWYKIQKSADQAREEGLDYVWVDTCCIDKSSSAELSEAINSMFEWYRRAAVCYAFLSDVEPPHQAGARELFSRCRWFTRGWTLQELVAPQHIAFYDAEWNFLGTKEDLVEPLSDITRIPPLALVEATSSLEQFTVAQKMAWAARRVTTREEDMSYCLLGIFDINMPLMYGEGGERAFRRLQEEIMRKYDDDSIFAWRVDEEHGHPLKSGSGRAGGLLATGPACFTGCEGVLAVPTDPQVDFLGIQLQLSAVAVTNRGLRVHRMVWPEGYWLLMPLRCWDVRRQPGPGQSIISITLTEHGMHETNQYSRLDVMTISVADLLEKRRFEEREFYLLQSQPSSTHLGFGLGGWLVTSRDVWIRSLPDGCLMHGLETSSPDRVTMSERTRLCRGLEAGHWVAFVLRCPAAQLPTPNPSELSVATATATGATAAAVAAAPGGSGEAATTPVTPRFPARDLYVALYVLSRLMSERPFIALASGPDPSSALAQGRTQMAQATAAAFGGGSVMQQYQAACEGPEGTVLYALLDSGEKRVGGGGGGGGGGGISGGIRSGGGGGSGGAGKRFVVDLFAMGNDKGAKVWDTSPLIVQGGDDIPPEMTVSMTLTAPPPAGAYPRSRMGSRGRIASVDGMGIRGMVGDGTIARRRRRTRDSVSISPGRRVSSEMGVGMGVGFGAGMGVGMGVGLGTDAEVEGEDNYEIEPTVDELTV